MHRDQRSRKGRWQEAAAVLGEVLVVPWQQLWGEALGLGVCCRRLPVKEWFPAASSFQLQDNKICKQGGKKLLPASLSYPTKCNPPSPELYCTAQLQKGQQEEQPLAMTTHPSRSPKSGFPEFSPIAEPRPLTSAHLLPIASMTSSKLLPRGLLYSE